MEASDSNSNVWKPTGGTIPNLDQHLNLGMFNEQPIYIHNTSAEGWAGIKERQVLGAAADKSRRGTSAKAGVYLCTPSQAFSPEAAFTLLFFCNEKYRLSSTHCIVFAPKKAINVTTVLVTEGSWVKETIHYGNISLKDVHVIYSGPNPFVSLTKQNHEMKEFDFEG
ncbi:MAG: hypothetical protein JF586_13375 [Burkholderiales bacterium]|jgi:hypothetical protein|nr:hypothetical protein [Burkholderiales bacterium]